MVSKFKAIKTLETIEDIISLTCYNENCEKCAFSIKPEYCIVEELKYKLEEMRKEIKEC